MQIQTGPMCFSGVVCIHKPSTSSSLIVPTLECETVPPPALILSQVHTATFTLTSLTQDRTTSHTSPWIKPALA